MSNENMAKEANKTKIDNENIENSKYFDKNEIEELVDRKATKFINLLLKSFYEFHENGIKKEEVSADADLDSEDDIISDILSKIVAKIRSLINLDKEEKKENEENKEPS